MAGSGKLPDGEERPAEDQRATNVRDGAHGERNGLTELLDELAAALEEVTRREEGGGVEYVRAGIAFAFSHGPGASFRLRPEVARAALRTPDVVSLPRGPGWVVFAPPDLDQFAVDRALAWFESVWRLAGE